MTDHQSMQLQLEAKAQAWIEAGQDPNLLPQGLELFRVICWSGSIGGAHSTDKSADLEAYLQASKDNGGGAEGWASMLRQREYCSECSETYRLENLSVCTKCQCLTCYRCTRPFGVHDNGNSRCECGGELVG